jgi:hypothetical protein
LATYTQLNIFEERRFMSSRRYSTYDLLEDSEGNKISLRLRKWSMTKCLSIMRELGDIVNKLGDHLNFEKDLTAVQMAQILVELGDEAVGRCTKILKESIEDPKLKEADIMEWCLEDYIGVLAKVIETNITEGLAKNLGGLKSAIVGRLPQAMPKPEAKPSPEPLQTSSSEKNQPTPEVSMAS